MLAPPDTKDQVVDSTEAKKLDTDNAAGKVAEVSETEGSKVKVVYKLCDLMKSMIAGWEKHFKDYIPDRVQVR